MERVKVRFAGSERRLNYDIIVGRGLIKRAPELSALQAKKFFFITDKRLSRVASDLQTQCRRAGAEVSGVTLPVSEASKDLRRLFPIYSQMLRAGLDRRSVVVAVGGGVIGDLAGFIAGTYLRGVRWVGVPTTLLAQVDSSVGGKTGVNHPLGKNLIGVFHQPSLVLCDTGVLHSLGERDRVSGLAEIIKYGLIFDKAFFAWLEGQGTDLLRLAPGPTEKAIRTALEWKAEVVVKDMFETAGLRRLLNFGHTLGHALEGATHYRYFRHGEAVLWGMRLAVALSCERGHLEEESGRRIDQLLSSFPVPEIPSSITVARLLAFTLRDKKREEGKLPFVLLDRLGHAIADSGVGPEEIRAAWKRVT